MHRRVALAAYPPNVAYARASTCRKPTMREQDRHFFDSPKKHFHHSIAVKSPHRSRSQRSSSFRKRSIASLCRLSASVFVPCPCSILCSAEVCHHWYRQLHSSSDRVPRSLASATHTLSPSSASLSSFSSNALYWPLRFCGRALGGSYFVASIAACYVPHTVGSRLDDAPHCRTHGIICIYNLCSNELQGSNTLASRCLDCTQTC